MLTRLTNDTTCAEDIGQTSLVSLIDEQSSLIARTLELAQYIKDFLCAPINCTESCESSNTLPGCFMTDLQINNFELKHLLSILEDVDLILGKR